MRVLIILSAIRPITWIIVFTLSVLSCSYAPNGPQSQAPQSGVIILTTSDFSTGSLAAISAASPGTSYTDLSYIHSDAVLKFDPVSGYIFTLNRYGQDSIQIIDPGAGYATIGEYHLGSGTNPQDIAIYSQNKAFVSLYNQPMIAVIDPVTGKTLDSIDLSPYADADGLPEAHALHLQMVNSVPYLFVSLQRLDRNNLYKPSGQSLVLVIDPAVNQVMKTLTLRSSNPNTDFIFSSYTGKLHVASMGFYGQYYNLDGGIETIHLGAGLADIRVENFLVSEQDTGQEINHFAITQNGAIYAIVSNAQYHTSFVRLDSISGQITETFLSITDSTAGYLSHLIYDQNTDAIYIASRNIYQPGVWVFDAHAGQMRSTEPVNTGLPPFYMDIIP